MLAARFKAQELPKEVCCRTQSEAAKPEGGPVAMWRWKAPWQRDSRAPVLRPRAAEACIRRWQARHLPGSK